MIIALPIDEKNINILKNCIFRKESCYYVVDEGGGN